MKIAGDIIELKNKGSVIIDFTVGEPDFPTPDNIKQAAINAINSNHTKYTKNSGLTELVEAVANKFKRDNNLDYSTDEIIISTGAKQGLFNALLSIIEKGDEVIYQSPFYTSYPHMISLAEGTGVVIKSREENGFKITKDELKNAVTKNSKVLIICNPSNPTGSFYSKSDLEELAEVVLENNLYVIADEIYEKIVFHDNKFTSFASLGNEIKDRTIVVNGVSKAYSMTGWRLGFTAGNKNIIAAMNKIQSHSTSNANTISQYAAIEALNGPQDSVIEMKEEYQKRSDYFFEKINGIKNLSMIKSRGALYSFINIKQLLGKNSINTSEDFAEFLLNEYRIAVIPGTVFGAEGYIRMSFATSMENIQEGIEKIRQAAESLSR
jgi:aspartate aminotransferase